MTPLVRLLGLAPALLLLGALMVAPLGIIVAYSFMAPDPYGGVLPQLSTDAYVRLLYERDFDDTLFFSPVVLRIFGRSLALALATTLLSLGCALPVAYTIARQPPARRSALLLLVTIPFWTNLLIRTYCWILILRDTGLVNTLLLRLGLIEAPLTLLYTNGAVLLGLVYAYLPFMVLPLYATLERLDTRLLEAAHDLYAGRWQVFRRVTLPLALPGLVAGSVLVFVPSLGAFVTPQLLGGGKNLMLGSLIQMQFAASRNWPFGAALALLLLAFVLLALLLYARAQSRAAGPRAEEALS
ncbi:ABC transporter permease [Truepera radiovictrix]|uniref:Binding-protein-dependent transport systems inner membrane component n=1 Tax=Truepera radiovictrix (strain DSM 17093 / CIP 108686 / LMG 22925 / RQ-24) TaxID=649638 RepID=D7CTB3_TRURR|nr:ABC transporter permease [Truepera radiovictrix]ADI15576.1 binding-protein-dependent transport systems inner membrane component [Truepera radiovictrix DSM 17093]WMT58795.1 ABC transporter permease [Truepera radiovictrix]